MDPGSPREALRTSEVESRRFSKRENQLPRNELNDFDSEFELPQRIELGAGVTSEANSPFLAALNSPEASPDDLFYLIHRSPIRVLLDSGASESFIDASYLEQADPGLIRRFRSDLSVRSPLSIQPVWITEQATFLLTIGIKGSNRKVYSELAPYIMPLHGEYDLILGKNDLKRLGLDVSASFVQAIRSAPIC